MIDGYVGMPYPSELADMPQPRWEDAHGVVHVAGTHFNASVWTECGLVIVRHRSMSRVQMLPDTYLHSDRLASCLQCICIEDRVSENIRSGAMINAGEILTI